MPHHALGVVGLCVAGGGEAENGAKRKSGVFPRAHHGATAILTADSISAILSRMTSNLSGSS